MNGVKQMPVSRLKAGAEEGLAEGEALAMISLYGVKDADGDRTKAGGFDDWAAEVNGGEPVAMVFQHGRRLEDHIGEVFGADPEAEDEKGRKGLAVKVRFDLEEPEGRKAYKMVKGRRVSQWSYAWEGDSEKLADGSRELSNMRLSEVSPVLRGALAETSTLAVKEDGEKDFAATWAGIGEMVQTDADLTTWIAKATGPDVAKLVAAVVQVVEWDEMTEAETGDTDAGDVPYFKSADPRIAQAKTRLALPAIAS